MMIEPLATYDYNKGYRELIMQLTLNVENQSFTEFCDSLLKTTNKVYVIRDQTQNVIATGSLFIEWKVTGKKAAHIEDVVVHKNHRGFGLGGIMLENLIEIAKHEGCYKIILNCDEKNMGFYEKYGFKKRDCGMVIKINTLLI